MRSRFRVVPVLDVMGGVAVRAAGGDRSRYRPVESILHPGCQPRKLAEAFRDALGLDTLYLADLDGIAGRGPSPGLYREVLETGLEVWLDAGTTDARDATCLPDDDRLHVVAGLETLRGPDALADILDAIGPDLVIVSLDLRDGRPITSSADAWGGGDAEAIAAEVLALGVRRLILLDLARVGGGAGMGTGRLVTRLLAERPGIEVIVGGGVARVDEVAEARGLGASAVLVGSALHDGRIGRDALRGLGAVRR